MLPLSFYQSDDVLQISKDLLGTKLISTIGGKRTAGIIVETEAYRAPDDKASHAYQNHLTERTSTMFVAGGAAYIYICYGIHHLFNVVTSKKGTAHVVLVRAIEPVEGLDFMEERRGMSAQKKAICNGPGKFTRAMGITKDWNGVSLRKKTSELWIEKGMKILPKSIIAGPRVGMSTAQECSNWPFRFRIKNNPWTSKPDEVFYEGL